MQKFDMNKFVNMILFFYEHTDKEKFAKTKALKLIFYSDFRHVREFGRPIIGDTYFHLPHGPIPTMSKDLLDILTCDHRNDTELAPDTIKRLREAIQIVEESTSNYSKFKVVGKKKCDYSFFSQSEIDVMNKVASEFSGLGGSDLSKRTHKTPAFRNTTNNQQIDYSHAFDPAKDQDRQAYYEFWKREYAELAYMTSHA
jgi:uncharacterized phage-associated protein